ncbi:MAG: hypothetical protein ABFD82_15470 [Syntrophaceae bacterium]
MGIFRVYLPLMETQAEDGKDVEEVILLVRGIRLSVPEHTRQ